MSVPTLQLQCPSCGQGTLAPALHPMQLWRCPHCAYQAAAEQFVPQESAPAAGRSTGHRFGPVTQAQPSLNPNAWHIHTFQPILPERGPATAPMPEMLPAFERGPQPQERDWVAAQAYVESRTAPLRRVFEPVPVPAVPPSPPPAPRILTTSSDWSPMKPGQLPKLTPWPGLAAGFDNGESDLTPPHLRGRARRFWFALLCLCIVGSAAAAMILADRQRSDQMSQLTQQLAQANATSPLRPSIPVPNPVPRPELPPESKLGLQETEAQAQRLMQSLLAATDDEARLACIAFPRQHRDSVRSFFAAQAEPLQLLGFRALPASVAVMPGRYPVTLCEARTSLPGKATAITRLISGEDGSFKLDWPMLQDSLGNKLKAYAAKPGTEPQWLVVGLKRNFGFTLPVSVRATHHVFDVQCSGNGTDRTLAVLPKDTPTGRAFDTTLAWNDLYIVRTLLHWSEVEGRPLLTILDGMLVEQE